MEQLKVGDVVYGKSYRDIYKCVIERVTATQAISGSIRFKIDYNGSWVSAIGNRGGYNRTSYYLGTPELDQEYLRSKVLSRINRFDFNVLNNNDLITINNIIKNYKDANM